MIRNIGVFAHVDAGKTTITEQLLYRSGKLRTLGRVDDGTASTDWLEVERSRGISVKAACTSFPIGDVTVNLIDTPGHVDFVSEVERSLIALDGAILVVSAVEGIQAHTEILWNALHSMKIPTIFFINKIDRAGADAQKVFAELSEQFGIDCIAMCDFSADDGKLLYDAAHIDDDLLNAVCGHDDVLLERYLNDEAISAQECYAVLKEQSRSSLIYPVLCGAAVKGIGIDALMTAIRDLLPPPVNRTSEEAAGVVFKLEHDKKMGVVAHIRLYGGTLKNRDTIYHNRLDCTEKVSQIRKMYANRYTDVGILTAGDIGAVCGIESLQVGDVIGHDISVKRSVSLSQALLKVRVFPKSEEEYPQLVRALEELSAEDPALNVEWVKQERELCVSIMGVIQLEILGSLLMERYGMEATFGPPSVIYKETLKQKGYGFADYTMPKPCWAILKFEMEPLPRGSGVVFETDVRDDKIFYRYQNQVRQAIPESLEQGMYGWEVTDVKIRLVDGSHHTVHTHPLDFVVATPMGIMDGLARNGTVLLEPMVRVRLSVPEDLGSKVIRDFLDMRGTYDSPVIADGRFTLEGRLPVATSLDYPQRLGAMSGGRGVISMRFDGYEPCPAELGKTAKRRGINPLDTAKYILWIRGALANKPEV